MELKKTDTIVARYAELPVLTPTHRFLVQVMEPIAMCAIEKGITVQMMQELEVIPDYTKKNYGFDPKADHNWNALALETLKRLLIKEWIGYAELDWVGPDDIDWIKKLDKVELIECDLLVPKVYAHAAH